MIYNKQKFIFDIQRLDINETSLEIYNKINKSKRLLIEENGYRLDSIYFGKGNLNNIADWKNIPEDIKKEYLHHSKKIFKTLMYMNNIKETIKNKRKNLKILTIKWEDNYSFILYNLDFKLFKNMRSKKNIKYIDLSFITELVFPITKNFNPFSRSLSVDLKREIFKRDNYTCAYCGWRNGLLDTPDKVMTLDHIISIAHGGTTKKENLITCCLHCNIKKNDWILDHLTKKIKFEEDI
jgi:hypothetical protein